MLHRMIEPTILLDPPLDADIMSEEIFGPLLPIITVREKVFIMKASNEAVNLQEKKFDIISSLSCYS
mgnify:CR=1 FL=1